MNCWNCDGELTRENTIREEKKRFCSTVCQEEYDKKPIVEEQGEEFFVLSDSKPNDRWRVRYKEFQSDMREDGSSNIKRLICDCPSFFIKNKGVMCKHTERVQNYLTCKEVKE